MDTNQFEHKLTGISGADAKKILNKNGNEYTDKEMKKIIDFLSVSAELEVQHLESQNEKVKKQIGA